MEMKILITRDEASGKNIDEPSFLMDACCTALVCFVI